MQIPLILRVVLESTPLQWFSELDHFSVHTQQSSIGRGERGSENFRLWLTDWEILAGGVLG